MHRFIQKTCVLSLVALLSSCVSRTDVEDLKKGQEQILAKLDKIEKTTSRPAPPAPPPQPQGPDASKVYALPINHSPVKGHDDAWVTLVIISDFQCPFCSRAVATLKEIEKEYPHDVRFVFKHNPLPFHNRALPAAFAAVCANEQHKFWPFHDKLFENQRALEDNNLETYAKEVGLDVAAFKKCFADSGKLKPGIDDDQSVASKFGARGTPAFFINGRFLSGAQPFPAFKTIIDEELKKAKDSGIVKKDYYNKAVVEKGEKSI